MDGINQIGKYLKATARNASLSLKRPVPLEVSAERIRDVFDPDNPLLAKVKIPPSMKRVTMDVNFGRKLPSLGCCADCMCGITESYTSDSLISGSIYVTTPYVPLSTVVYLDGVQSTLNVEYTEANPATGQIAILIPVDTIVISYVYTVGNCTDSLCIDERFACIGYTYYANLVTVFSDRFDRPGNTSIPSGGCGLYFSTYNTAIDGGYVPFIPTITGTGFTNSTSRSVFVGGVDKLVGKSWEIFAAFTAAAGNFSILATNNFYGVSVSYVSTTSTLSLGGLWRGYTPFFADPTIPVMGESTFTRSTPLTLTVGSRYWIRWVQFPNGWGVKVWLQADAEPAAYNLTMDISHVTSTADTMNREVILPTICYLTYTFPTTGLEGIQMGAALDDGAWGYATANEGMTGYYCANIPDGLTRFGYNCGVNDSSVVTFDTTTVSPSAFYNMSFPHFVGTPAGSGRLIDYQESVASWRLWPGHPTQVRVKAQLFITTHATIAATYPTLPVQVKPYGGIPPSIMTRNGFIGGGFTYGVPTDGTPIDVNFVMETAGESILYWGVGLINIDATINSLPFIEGPFLFPNNTSVTASFRNIIVEGTESITCTAPDMCNDCENSRCPDVQDSFEDTATYAFGVSTGTAGVARTIAMGDDVIIIKDADAQIAIAGGQAVISFQNDANPQFLYGGPFSCQTAITNIYTIEAKLDLKITTPGAGETINFDITAGLPEIRISSTSSGTTGLSGSVTPSYSAVNPVAFGVWYTAKVRIVNTAYTFKIWPSATTEPAANNYTGTITSSVGSGFMLDINNTGSGPDVGTVSIRNLTVTRES